ncbi:hypothetical protein JW826_02515 [Candidatus Woesearchaeota archaeon]|nr:hypothetical protein [Candidatus Woesearchaeota archaeon]
MAGCAVDSEKKEDRAEDMLSRLKYDWPGIAQNTWVDESDIPEYLSFYDEVPYRIDNLLIGYVRYDNGKNGYRLIFQVSAPSDDVNSHYGDAMVKSELWNMKGSDYVEEISSFLLESDHHEMIIATAWCGETTTCVVIQTSLKESVELE